MKKIILCSVCAFVLVGIITRADEGQWYNGIEASYSILGQEDSIGSVLDLQSLFKKGWAFGGNVGHDFGSWRLEGEVGKHFHDADQFKILSDAGLELGAFGNVKATSGKSRLAHYMMNVVYDLGRFSTSKSVEPFIGIGLGIANMELLNLSTSSGAFTDDFDTVFAYQMFAGVRVPLENSIEMSLKYRFLATTDASMMDRLGNRFKASYGDHDLILGLTYRLGGNKKKTVVDLPKPIAVAALEFAP